MRSFYPWPLLPLHLPRHVLRSLSLQFILKELLKGFRILDEMYDTKFSTEKLLAPFITDPLCQKAGVLDKLCFYSEILLQNSNVKALHVLEHLRSLFSNETPIQREELIKRMKLGFLQFFEAIKESLYEARSDESVLVFLMENKQLINQYLGSNSLEKMLDWFFPEGPDQLRAVLFEGYSRRGFFSFFQQIEPLIDASFYENAHR